MSRNASKPPIKMKSSRHKWEVFDNLPREVRDAINYSAFKYTVTGGRLTPAQGRAMARQILATDAKQVAAAYSQREALDELKDLGL